MTGMETVVVLAERTDAVAAGALHDFNNAVQAIGATVRLMERRVARNETESLQTIIAAVGHQVTRIASLGAALARSGVADARANGSVIPVGPFVFAMMPQVAALLDDNTRLDLFVDPLAGHVACDPARLESAIRNLVLNARDAMPEGGVLVLRVGVPNADGTDVRSERFVSITVADTGCGMAPDTLRRCLDPFMTTKTMTGGSGLGLFQLRTFAEEAGGSVRLQSREGQGTEATILLPCSEPPGP